MGSRNGSPAWTTDDASASAYVTMAVLQESTAQGLEPDLAFMRMTILRIPGGVRMQRADVVIKGRSHSLHVDP
jgi:hypothetical protein